MGQYKRKEDDETLNYILDVVCKSVLYDRDVSTCFQKVKYFSNELYRHSLNVAFLSMILGVEQYEGHKELDELFIAALLHDYGKLYFTKNILEKADILTYEERKTIELHSIIGFFYLKQETKLSDNILNAVLDHHEKVDGSGYGLCKKNDDISGYAKIITIADVYDAMVSDRIYRKRIDRHVVNEYLHKNAGKYFDKDLTNQFLYLTKNMDLECMELEFINNLKMLQRQFEPR